MDHNKPFWIHVDGDSIVGVLKTDKIECHTFQEVNDIITKVFDRLDKSVHIVPTTEDSDERGWIISVNE